MIGDPDLLAFRRGYYELLTGLFAREPGPQVLRSLGEGIEARAEAAATLHPLLGRGWSEIARYLRDPSGEEIPEPAADEFTRLFIGPFGGEIQPYESYYLTGRVFERPLAAVRAFLREAGLEREGGAPEPEDWLAFELDVMRRLIVRQAAAGDPDGQMASATMQAAFLKRHLLVWVPTFAEHLSQVQNARLYRGVGLLLAGFLALELMLVKDWGPEEVRSLEERRQAYAGRGAWKGPLVDPQPRVGLGPPVRPESPEP
ncbi:MAG: TorD/DmsD family molecular chaperone [Candidatus Rokuibacteriota bacterium]